MFLLGLKLNTARTSWSAVGPSKMHPVSDVQHQPHHHRVREWVPMVLGGSLIKRARDAASKENKLVCLFPAIKSLASHPKARDSPTTAANAQRRSGRRRSPWLALPRCRQGTTDMGRLLASVTT